MPGGGGPPARAEQNTDIVGSVVTHRGIQFSVAVELSEDNVKWCRANRITDRLCEGAGAGTQQDR